jgi:hypothetical protein
VKMSCKVLTATALAVGAAVLGAPASAASMAAPAYGDGYTPPSYVSFNPGPGYYASQSGYFAPGSGYTTGYRGGGDDTYCAQTFRSYDPTSGTYLGYDGRLHSCP